jgi:hypothetical protein
MTPKYKTVRDERDQLLLESDWTQSADSPLDADTKAAWATYRQELRDLPSQEGFPNVAFPKNPDQVAREAASIAALAGE